MFRSVRHEADYLNEKSRSVKSEFSTLSKIRAHVRKYSANDTSPHGGGGNRNWGGLWPTENRMSFPERVFFLALSRCYHVGNKSPGLPDHLLL